MNRSLDFLKIIRIIDKNNLSFFTSNELAEIVNVETKSIQNYLETLANNGLIIRIEKGKYCRTYLKDRLVIGSKLIRGGVVSYQTALFHHGLIQGNSNEVFISSNHQKHNKSLFDYNFHFIKIRSHKYFGFYKEKNRNGEFRVSDTEKTILDCFDLPQYATSYEKLVSIFGRLHLDEEKLIDYGLKMQNLSVLKRLAYLSEQLHLPGYYKFKNTVAKLKNEKYTLLNPSGQDIGPFHAKWRIRDNMKQPILQ